MKWTSKRTLDNIDLEFFSPGTQATDHVDRSSPRFSAKLSGRKLKDSKKGFGKSSALQVGGGKRFRWFQVFFGLSFRACRIAFLTAHVREGLEVFWRRLALEPPADNSAPMVCVGWHSRQQVGLVWFLSGPIKLKTTPLLQPRCTTSLSKWM